METPCPRSFSVHQASLVRRTPQDLDGLVANDYQGRIRTRLTYATLPGRNLEVTPTPHAISMVGRLPGGN